MSVSIYVYPTSFRVKCDCRGILKEYPGHKVTSFINQLTEMQFNHRYRRWEILYRYLHYDRKEEMLYLPRYTLDDFLSTISGTTHEIINMPHTPVRRMNIKLKEKYKLRPDQEDLVDFLTNPETNFKALSARTGIGKMNPHSTRIKIPGGWTTMGEIQVGDMIVTPSGEAAPVIGKFPQGIKTLWRVEFEDGRYTECGKEHLWSIHINGMDSNERMVVTTAQIRALMDIGKICHIDLISPESKEVGPDMDFLVEPYRMGASVAKNDTSSIPYVYFCGSHDQRVSLLKGLMDTNGNVTKYDILDTHGNGNESNYGTYTTTNEQLKTDIIQLVYSIGGKAMCMEKVLKGTEEKEYTVYIELKRICDISTRYSNDNNCTIRDFKLLISSVKELIDKQEECSCIMVDHSDHLYIVDDYIVTHNTFCACAAMANIGNTTLILTAGLIHQWWKELLDKTTLRKSDIYVIQGSDSLRKLIGATGYHPKVILASIRTMMMYVTAKKLPYSAIIPYNEFQVKYGIGLKIIDEVHENFFANTIIDVHSNIQHNIYLSASYERSNPVGERIFNKVFPKEKRYGDHLIRRYTTVNMLGYRAGTYLDETKLHTNQGYSHPRYEQWILKNYSVRDTFFDAVVRTTLDAYFLPNRKEKQKCLFVCSTTDMVNAMAAYITKTYPELGVLCFYGDDDQSSITDRIDVIVSTIKKSGVGVDIKGLKVAVNTISFKALPLAKQLMGRLREIKGDETIFLDYYNYELNSHYRHKEARASRYRDLAAKYYEAKVN